MRCLQGFWHQLHSKDRGCERCWTFEEIPGLPCRLGHYGIALIKNQVKAFGQVFFLDGNAWGSKKCIVQKQSTVFSCYAMVSWGCECICEVTWLPPTATTTFTRTSASLRYLVEDILPYQSSSILRANLFRWSSSQNFFGEFGLLKLDIYAWYMLDPYSSTYIFELPKIHGSTSLDFYLYCEGVVDSSPSDDVLMRLKWIIKPTSC